ncbi:sulfotransferase [Leptolyngbya sp. Heron Island J]|uniref:sulfotransferase family protein n=1 Tax=Leptolyngbya sp. Heron Island J TaxID=1385935 RepID=UPI0003B9C21B|nr:sulfotransferase domain-containing protein [Leptolyngbya sp. Heron Island J]ESA32695.1 sulfotransferase [Leptolyngbya sp. Heron Island J]
MPSFLQKLNGAALRRIDSVLQPMIWQARRATSWHRTLPSFIIVGAQKSGTTSLYDYLTEHPQLWPAYIKEVHFFDGGLSPKSNNFQKGEGWYRANFPLKSHIKTGEQTFEASPLYMFNPLVAQRIFNLIPQAKIIAILRNPTERAISHYFHERRYGRETLDIAEAIATEEKRLAPMWANQDYKNEIFIHLSYKSRGHYAEQLKRFLDYFPRENLLVLNAENLFQDPASVLQKVCQFIDIDSEYQFKNLRPRNIASNRISVASSVYKALDYYFEPHNHELYKLLGESFNW